MSLVRLPFPAKKKYGPISIRVTWNSIPIAPIEFDPYWAWTVTTAPST
jgi:hypothetical protein